MYAITRSWSFEADLRRIIHFEDGFPLSSNTVYPTGGFTFGPLVRGGGDEVTSVGLGSV